MVEFYQTKIGRVEITLISGESQEFGDNHPEWPSQWLTPIDELVVILLEGLGVVSSPLKMCHSHTFKPVGAVVMKGDFLKGTPIDK